MQGDFTRNTFKAQNHYSRVLMQQGRVQIDADWNEQIDILLHYFRTLAMDLIGPHGGPIENCGFEVIVKSEQLTETYLAPEKDRDKTLASMRKKLESNSEHQADFLISKGRYYVNGLLCENEELVWYSKQSHLPPPHVLELEKDSPYLIYIDAYEHHVTSIDDVHIREVALNGADTATRSKVVWQVRAEKALQDFHEEDTTPPWQELVRKWQPDNRGRLIVKASLTDDSQAEDQASSMRPDSRYRGPENQLYRVEIHQGGSAEEATFKWSRENGSVVIPLAKESKGDLLTLSSISRDPRIELRAGDWVEVLADGHGVFHGDMKPHPLLNIVSVDLENKSVKVAPGITAPLHQYKQLSLRRWDHKEGDTKHGGLTLLDGAAHIREGHGNKGWLTLERGVQCQFQKTEPGAEYRSGDYWLIPARTSEGADIEWSHNPAGDPPHGVHHHYAPLAVILLAKSKNLILFHDYRKVFAGLAKPIKK